MLKAVETGQSAEQSVDAQGEHAPKRGLTASIARGVFQVALMAGVIFASYTAMERLIAAKPERTARPQFEVVVPVQAHEVALGDQRPTVRLFGEVVAGRSVDIRSSVSGEVLSVNSDLSAGSLVEEGEELFSVDRFNYESALAEAKANLAQTDATIAEGEARLASERSQLALAEAQLSLAKDDLARAEQLRENGTLTQKQVDDRTLVVSQREQSYQQRSNNIAVEEARAAQQRAIRERQALGVERAQRDLNNTIVRAPFSGIVRSSTVEIGRIVSANDVAVAMYDDKALDVRFTLTNAQYGRIAIDGDSLVGRTVDVVWSVGGVDYEYSGTVSRIGADIASERGGVDVFARLNLTEDAQVQIRPGAFVGVSVPDRLYTNAARVPETAIFDIDKAYVIVDGQLQARTVRVVAFDDGDAIVAEGFQNGDQVLATRLSEIDENLKVRIVDENGVDTTVENSASNSPVAGGRPTPELIAAAKQISGLSDTEWEALSRDERRPFIQQARQAADN